MDVKHVFHWNRQMNACEYDDYIHLFLCKSCVTDCFWCKMTL